MFTGSAEYRASLVATPGEESYTSGIVTDQDHIPNYG
jgi:hypothetical protein